MGMLSRFITWQFARCVLSIGGPPSMQQDGAWTPVRLGRLMDEHSDDFRKRLREECLGWKQTEWGIWKESVRFSRKPNENAKRDCMWLEVTWVLEVSGRKDNGGIERLVKWQLEREDFTRWSCRTKMQTILTNIL